MCLDKVLLFNSTSVLPLLTHKMRLDFKQANVL